VRGVPWYYLTGGLLGAAYVTSILVTVRTLGAGGVVVATIAGQLALSVVVDHFGLIGVTKQPITLTKILGLVLLAFGVYLVVRE
jgi:transporter family-2 protein